MKHAAVLSTVLLLQGKKGRRKVGRPITYQGSPSSPDLSPEERRVILRRIANRESARRVRDRRNEELNKFIQRVSTSVFCSVLQLDRQTF